MPIETAAEREFSSITRQVSKLMEQFQRGFFSFCPTEGWTPAVNVYENGAAYLVCADLAGVEKEAIEVEVVENALRLRGRRAAPLPENMPGSGGHPGRLRVHLMEIDHGTYCRIIELPEDVARDQVRATYQNGLLWVELPKKRH